jgi:hypothetical protein
LFQANRWDWQPHRKLGTKYLVVLCAGSALLLAEDESTSIVKRRPCWSAIKPVRITFSRLSLLSKNDKPWFLNWGKTSCYTHHTFLLGFPTGWSFTTHKESSGAINHAPAQPRAKSLPWTPSSSILNICSELRRPSLVSSVKPATSLGYISGFLSCSDQFVCISGLSPLPTFCRCWVRIPI